jgi:acyl-CoA synthetase (AMP-forming)/AMP-acid ligase II
VAQGYWGRPVETAATFADGWLRTGDLGFLADGELFITGRKKDLVLLRGRNLYPQDLELAAEAAHPDLRQNASAAFGVEIEGEEKLVLVAEIEPRRSPDATAVIEAVAAALAQGFDASVHEVVLLPAGALPRTSSGKVRRAATKAAWLGGTLVAARSED